jgi:hypothetical protein
MSTRSEYYQKVDFIYYNVRLSEGHLYLVSLNRVSKPALISKVIKEIIKQ